MTIKMKVFPRFPTSIEGSGNITATLANGVWTIALDVTSVVGSSVQAWDQNLQDLADITYGTGFTTFVATPSSANLRALLTDETGTGSAVFGTSPGFTTAANPISSDGAALGTTALMWSDLFLASGGVINWNNGDVTATHSANALTFAGAASGYFFDTTISAANYLSSGVITSSSATSGVGYATGAGGAVTQITSRTTGVTLNKVSGAITLFTAAGSATDAQFTVTNSAVAATDTISLNVKSGTNKYLASVTTVSAGSFEINFRTTGGTSSDAPVFNFNVIKGVAA